MLLSGRKPQVRSLGLGILLALVGACGDSEGAGTPAVPEQGLSGQAGGDPLGPPPLSTTETPPAAPAPVPGMTPPASNMPMAMPPAMGMPDSSTGMPGGPGMGGFPGIGSNAGSGGTPDPGPTDPPSPMPEPPAAMADSGMPMPEPEPDVYSPCPTTGEPCKIMPLGDSITEGTPYNNGGYRVQLFTRAVEAGKSITFVGSRPANGPREVAGEPFPRDHEGTAGITIERLNGRVPSPAFSDTPHIVLIHIGTNDLSWAGTSNPDQKLDQLISDVIEAAPEALVVVAQLIPIGFGSVGSYNDAIPGIVEKRQEAGEHVEVVDMSGFPSSMLGDGVHPSEAGYATMGDMWFEAIEEYLP